MSVKDSPDIVRNMGRPNKITRAMIVEAARDIGLDNVTMTSVAARLGVSVGALYRHVKDRSELQRLVASVQIREDLTPQDTGQHWADLVRQYTEMLYLRFAHNPGLIAEYAGGGFPPSHEVEMLENYLTAMRGRGFLADDALELIRDSRAIAIGAAVVASSRRATDPRLTPGEQAERALDDHGADDLPMLNAARSTYRRLADEPGWKEPMERVLRAVAAARGETLPDT